MKKGVEWLAMLSKENQVLFCRNRVNVRDFNQSIVPIAEYLNAEYPSFDAFLRKAFVWQLSPQGHDYWEHCSNNILIDNISYESRNTFFN